MNTEGSSTHIVITYPFPLGRASGGARMTREIARHLGLAGARVTLLPVSARLRDRFPRREVEREFQGHEYDEELRRDGVRIERVPPHPLHYVLDGKRVRHAVERILEREPVDAVLSYFVEGAFLPALLQPRGVTFGYISAWQSYIDAVTPVVPRLPRFVLRRLEEHLLAGPHRRADVLFASSGFTRDEMVSELGVSRERIRLCYLGVEPGFFEIPREPEETVERILFFGRIVPSKGILDTVQALGRLAARSERPFTFRVRGAGHLDWVRQAAREAGIGERVVVEGPADDVELRRELADAQLVIMPSRIEAFGLAFAEAQAAGLPVIAYRAGSVPEVVEDGATGWLAPVGDIDGLSRLAEQALADPAGTFRAGLAGRERVRRTFTWAKTAATILGGLRDLTERGRGGAAAERA